MASPASWFSLVTLQLKPTTLKLSTLLVCSCMFAVTGLPTSFPAMSLAPEKGSTTSTLV